MSASLPEVSWHEQIEAWLPICADAMSVSEQIACLNFAADRFHSAPDDISALLGKLPDATKFEQLTKLGAVESAAASLVSGVAAAYMQSSPVGGPAMCTVVLAGTEQEVTFQAKSGAMARLGAVSKALFALAQKPAAQQHARERNQLH